MAKLRKPARQYSLARRSLALTSLDRIKKKKYTLKLRDLELIQCLLHDDHAVDEDIEMLQIYYLHKYVKVAFEPEHFVFDRNPRKNKCLDDFTMFQCRALFRLTKVQLRELYQRLDVPPIWRLENRLKFNGEEIFLYSLRRLVYPNRHVDLCTEFGGEYSQWSRAFRCFITWLVGKWKHKIVGSMELWADMIPNFAKAIQKVLVEKLGLQFMAEANFRVFGFIDNTIIKTCRPGGGPAEAGQGARRFNRLIQQAYYLGYKHLHGLKVQLSTLPNGMIADSSEVLSCRHHDLFMLTDSNLCGRLQQISQGLPFHTVYTETVPMMSRCRVSALHTMVRIFPGARYN